MTLNAEKCIFLTKIVKFLGHTIRDGKTRAILEIKEPMNNKVLGTFFGMVTYLVKFTPNLVTVPKLLDILKGVYEWVWSNN